MANFLDRYSGYQRPDDGTDEDVVPPNAPNTPTTPVLPNGPISEPVLAQMAKTNPDLVEQYRQKMAASGTAMQDAKDDQDMGNYANVGGRLLNDLGNSQKKDVILKNRMQDLGKSPTIKKADRPAYDDSVINNITAQGVSRAKDMRQTDSQDFGEEQKLTDLQAQRGDQQINRDKAAREADPNSDESKQAREVLKRAAPNAGDIPGFDGMSSAQIQKIAPQLMERYKQDQLDSYHRDEMKSKSEEHAVARQAVADSKQASAYSEMNNRMTNPRGNSAVQDAQKAMRSISNAQELIDQYPDLNQMPPQQVALLNAEIAKIASGGVGTEHGQQTLEANTLRERLAKFQSQVGNAPTGAQLAEFIKQNKQYLDGLAKVNKKVVNDYQRQVYKGYQGRLSPEQQRQFEQDNPDVLVEEAGAAGKKPVHGADLP